MLRFATHLAIHLQIHQKLSQNASTSYNAILQRYINSLSNKQAIPFYVSFLLTKQSQKEVYVKLLQEQDDDSLIRANGTYFSPEMCSELVRSMAQSSIR